MHSLLLCECPDDSSYLPDSKHTLCRRLTLTQNTHSAPRVTRTGPPNPPAAPTLKRAVSANRFQQRAPSANPSKAASPYASPYASKPRPNSPTKKDKEGALTLPPSPYSPTYPKERTFTRTTSSRDNYERPESGRRNIARMESARSTFDRQDSARRDIARMESGRSTFDRQESTRSNLARMESGRTLARMDSARTGYVRMDSTRSTQSPERSMQRTMSQRKQQELEARGAALVSSGK